MLIWFCSSLQESSGLQYTRSSHCFSVLKIGKENQYRLQICFRTSRRKGKKKHRDKSVTCTGAFRFLPLDNSHPGFRCDEQDSDSVFCTQQADAHHMTLAASSLPVKEVNFSERHPMNKKSCYSEVEADTVSVDEKTDESHSEQKHLAF